MAPEGGYRTPDGQGRGDERQRQISEIPSTSGLNGALMGAMPHRSIVHLPLSSDVRPVCALEAPEPAFHQPRVDGEEDGAVVDDDLDLALVVLDA